MWGKLLFILLAIFFGWLLYRQVKGNPQAFSRKSFSDSFWTMGLLALFLIAFIAVLVMIVRH